MPLLTAYSGSKAARSAAGGLGRSRDKADRVLQIAGQLFIVESRFFNATALEKARHVLAVPTIRVLVQLYRRASVVHVVPEQTEQRIERRVAVVLPVAEPLRERNHVELHADMRLEQRKELLQREIVFVGMDQ